MPRSTSIQSAEIPTPKLKTLVVGNWKMNPESAKKATQIVGGLKTVVSKLRNTHCVIAPSFIHLPAAMQAYKGKKIAWGAQDVFWENAGSFTGEVSPVQLKDLGVTFIIIGHSERRQMGETGENIHQKLLATMQAKLTPIVCIGESERRDNGDHLRFIESQLHEVFADIPARKIPDIVIAYEPLWAIGKTASESIDPNDLHEMSLYIRKILTAKYGKAVAYKTRIIYGGSVETSNVESLHTSGNMDGFLVGHSSLNPHDFGKILQIIDKIKI